MKLYQSNASPNSRRVRIYLAEKGISMPLVPVDIGAKEQFSDAYAATKGAIDTLVKHFAALLGPRGIRVNAVAPGVIDTDMSSFVRSGEGRDYTLGMQALQRIGHPDDVADVVSFLASDAARWVTGDTIQVGGGSKI